MVVRRLLIGALTLGGCAEAATSPAGGGAVDPGGAGQGGDGADAGAGADGGVDDPGGGQQGGGDGGGQDGGGGDGGGVGGDGGGQQGGGDGLIVNLADGGTVREAALPPGSLAVVRPAAGVDDRAHRFVRMGKPGGVDPAKDEAAGLAALLWSDAYPPALGEDGGAAITEERSDDGTRLAWQATSQDVRYGVMYVMRGAVAAARTLIPPRTGGLGVDVPGLLVAGGVQSDVRTQDGAASLPIQPLPEAMMVQWSATKPLLCPGLELEGFDAVPELLADERLAADHKLLAVLDLLDAVGAVLRAASPASAWGCVREHVAGAVAPTVGAVAPRALGADELIAAVAQVLDGSLGAETGDACLGGGTTLLPALARDALSALGSVTEAEGVDSLPAGCAHATRAGFRVDRDAPFERPACDAQETCDNNYDDDCTGAVDDDASCGCDANRYVPYCDGDDLRERNGCGETRAVRRCDHSCQDGACQGCVDPTYDPYCEGDDVWEENDCGTTRLARECEHGCERGECEGCQDPSYDRYCDRDAVWERNDCGDSRRVRDCEFGCDDGACEDCNDPGYDRYCNDDEVWERNDCGDERGVVQCACGCDGGVCNGLSCDAGATRCNDDVQETCVGGCGWDGPANCACGCAGRACGAVPANDGTTEHDREGNDNASTRRQGEAWVISGAGRVGEVWSDGHDPVILVSEYALEGDDDWYYLVVDDGAFGRLEPRVLLEPPATTDLDLRVTFLNNEDRVFVPSCDTGDECNGVAGHAGCCSDNGGDNDDEVRFSAETGLRDENTGVLLIRVQSFRTPNICDFYTLYIWI